MNEQYFEHHGILGQKWGVRRFQNEDGSLTSAGKKRYDVEGDPKPFSKDSGIGTAKGYTKRLNDIDKALARNNYDLMKSANRLAKIQRKGMKAEAKGNEKKSLKQFEKYKKENEKTQEIVANISLGKSESRKLIGEAISKGMTVYAKPTARYVGSGKEYLLSIATLGVYTKGLVASTEDQYKYKVKK